MQAGLTGLAFSCAMRYNGFLIGVELLKQGRGILWNQLARFDISIVGELGEELRKHAGGFILADPRGMAVSGG